jgi:hypothetical protein
MDLINKIGAKPQDSVNKKIENNAAGTADIGADLLKTAQGTGTKVEEKKVEVKAEEKKVEESKKEEVIVDAEDWTKESAFKEVKRLREENKAYRIKYEEKLTSLKDETESRIKAREQELEQLKVAQQELEDIKAKEADKKRDLAEKLAHRETLLSDFKTKMEQNEREFKKRETELTSQLDRYHADQEAQKEVYKQRLQDELKDIPEKFKGVADLIVKGAGDSRDALVAINEAKLQGVFTDKTVIVNHNVPGAHDGARATKERLEEAGRADRAKMSSSQKIKEALTQIRSGEKNTAFRSNR